jgi:thiol-disulfide isomerase/thioredoxin
MLNRLKDFLALLVLAAMAISAIGGLALSEDWNSYSPVHSLGSGENDWWTSYPDQNAKSGSKVEHPTWILDTLKEKPVLVLIHSSNCKPCLIQIPRIENAANTFAGDLKYYDILAEGNGFREAIDILDVYDPVGGKQYVPTTIFITLIKGPDGNVNVGWHSMIDAMSEDQINAYTKDSIYYHKQNVADWR